MSDFVSRWFSDDFLRSLRVAVSQKCSVGASHWFSDDVSHRLPDEFVQRLSDVFVRKLPDDAVQRLLDVFLQRHTDDVARRYSSDFLLWLLYVFFPEEADVLSQEEPKVFVPTRWDKDYTKPDVLEKRVEDSRKSVAAWRKRVEAARERLDYFSQWFSDDFLQRFLDALLQRPSNAFSQWLTNLAEWDEEVAQAIWDDYYGRMVRLARQKLEGFGVSRGDYDEEDVASDAMLDFYRGMKKRQFPDLHSRDNLRRLLFTITVRKANDRRKLCFTQKHGGGWVPVTFYKVHLDPQTGQDYIRTS